MGQKEIMRKIGKYIEINEVKNTIYQNLWDVVKTVFKQKFIGVNTYVKNIPNQ